MKINKLIVIALILIGSIIILSGISYILIFNKNSKNKSKSYETLKFTEERCDDKYCISDSSLKYIEKDKSYYKIKGLLYYKSDDVIDNYCVKLTFVSEKSSLIFKKCYKAGFSNFFTNIDEIVESNKYIKYSDIKIERMTDEEINEFYMN